MIKFEKEKVLLLHQMIAHEIGGTVGIRDEGLLERMHIRHLAAKNYIKLKRKKQQGLVFL